MHDLAIIVVSTNEAHWLRACLSTALAHRGECLLEVVVADNQSTDGTADVVAEFAPDARAVRCPNRGFAHANNRAFLTTNARYALFLNPDTEVLEGTFGALVDALDERPEVGLAGVRQVTADRVLYPTIRRFPNALRALGQALLPERLPGRPSWLGERDLRLGHYDRELSCDWTSGSFMIVRREALESAGLLDERFFIYSEEPDLCLRIKRAGWDVRHLPSMTILHHAGKGASSRMAAQDAFARMQYARKHFSAPHRIAYVGALGLGYTLRAASRRARVDGRREQNLRALRTLLGRDAPPFGEPPASALAPHVGAGDT